MGDYICDNPEIGLKEYKASALLSEYLRQNGYETQLGVGGLDTAFRAEWKTEEGDRQSDFCANMMLWME